MKTSKCREPKVPKNATDPEQSARFIEAAKQCGEDGENFERSFRKTVPPRKSKSDR